MPTELIIVLAIMVGFMGAFTWYANTHRVEDEQKDE